MSAQSFLWEACYTGDEFLVKTSLQEDAQVDECNANHVSCLHVAAAYGYASILSLLLKHSVNVDKRNGRGLSALHIAAKQNNLLCAKALVDVGADITATVPVSEEVAQDDAGLTPIEMASKYKADLVVLFLEKELAVRRRQVCDG